MQNQQSIKSIEKHALRVSDFLSQYGLGSESLDSGGSLFYETLFSSPFLFQGCNEDSAKSRDRVNTISPPRPPLRNSQRDLCRAISSSDNYWLDREVITFGESLKSIYYIRGRTVWRDSNGVYMNLLTTSKQIYDDVQQVFFSRFAFDALGWGYTMRYSDRSKTPNHLPKHRIMHIAYTP
jgi:hypothetical protein